MSYKRWIIKDADKSIATSLSEKLNIDPLIAYLLAVRGIENELEASEFINDSVRLSSPYSYSGMDKAAEKIKSALENGDKICIYGDYDCDGVTATALLYTFLQDMGGNVFYYIPHRQLDGYGMNKGAIDKIKANGASLIVTVDNGITAFEEASYVADLGMSLVITDHHQPSDTLPQAYAVVNPHLDEGRVFSDFSGVGVAFKLACAIYDGDEHDLIDAYADLVAIGTIGDIVPLRDENRTLVKAGINLINNDSRLGVTALKNAAACGDNMTSGAVAFQLCPRINAAGRMNNAASALELLISEDQKSARHFAELLCEENEHRHQVENEIAEDISEKISRNPAIAEERVIVVDGLNYHKGVIGISASHVVEAYGKPAIVIGVDEDGEGTGSARSVEGFNICDAISSCADILTHYGGHPLAAGLGIRKENIELFRQRINEYAAENFSQMPEDTLTVDCKLSPFYLTLELAEELSGLEPFGAGNKQPVFGLFNMTLKNVIPMGEGKHIKLEAEKKGKIFRLVMFRQTAQDFIYNIGDTLDFAVKISKNIFKGRSYLSIQAIDVRRHGIDEDKYFSEKADYRRFVEGGKNKGELYPSRDVCALIYKYLKKNSNKKFLRDDLYFALSQQITYGQLCFALKAFEETSLIEKGEPIALRQTAEKIDLERCETLRNLKGRL